MAWTFPAISDPRWKILLFVLLSIPLVLLGWDIAGELRQPGSRLGADPATAVVLELGTWAIRILLLSLMVSTLRRLTNTPQLLRFRRMIGLFAFAYVTLHFCAYLGFLAGFDWQAIKEDLVDRTYITVGFLALLLLVPLAVTSTNGWRRRLGRRWLKLHRLVYVIVSLGLLHYFWLTKDGFEEGALYLAVFAVLMLERGYRAYLAQRTLPA
jgi:sulfoxide reductase heme-binding subunit YedZ